MQINYMSLLRPPVCDFPSAATSTISVMMLIKVLIVMMATVVLAVNDE